MGQVIALFFKRYTRLVAPVLIIGATVFVVPAVSADRFESGNYVIDASTANSFGGGTNSSSYKMVSSGGEAVIGEGQAGSYKLGEGYIAQLEKSLQLSIQPADLLVYFPLNENVGARIYDNFTSADNASLVNAPTWAAGKIGNALDFDGVNQYADGGASKFNTLSVLAGESQTFSMWIKAGAQSTDKNFLWKEGSCKGWSFRMLATGTISMRFRSTATDCTGSVATEATSTATYADNVWHHVAGVINRSNGTMELFVDGASAATNTVNTDHDGAGGNFIIGSNWDNSRPFDGAVDEVQVYNRALSAKEVSNLYSAQNTGVTSALTFATLDTISSKTVSSKAVVQTDAPGYSIALSQDGNMTSGANNIPAISSGTIATPSAWSEGTTKGLGFTLTSGNNLDSKWGTNPNYNYAAIPGTSTSFYTRSGYTGGVKDVLSIEHRVDVPSNQPFGDYKNTVTYTATITP